MALEDTGFEPMTFSAFWGRFADSHELNRALCASSNSIADSDVLANLASFTRHVRTEDKLRRPL